MMLTKQGCKTVKTRQEIDDMLDQAADLIDSGSTRFSAMGYVEGVRAALEWAMDEDDDESPLE